MEEIDKEISEMKISHNARARIVAEEFLKNVSLAIISKVYNFCSFEFQQVAIYVAMTVLSLMTFR